MIDLWRICLTGAAMLALSLGVPRAQEKSAGHFKVGLESRSIAVDKPYNWRGAQTHALSALVWYPADASAKEEPQWLGPPGRPLFAAGRASVKAPIAKSPARFPLVVLSHGTGGSAIMMAWLGTALAANGCIAAAVNHPGNNGADGYTVQGFSTWWERAKDLSVVIDAVLADSVFGSRIDPKRIGAAGFSLGGYTMIEIAGGITVPGDFTAFCKSPNADDICKSPPEFPTLVEDLQKLTQTDAEFQAALKHAGDSYRDPRVRAVFAMAPALGPAFPAAGLAKISIPVEIVTGSADTSVPIGSNAKYFEANIPGAKLVILPQVGHYAFLDSCTEQGRQARPLICTDGPGVDRDAIHDKTVALALTFFESNLNKQ